MKKLITVVGILSCFASQGQRAVLAGDTIFYNGSKFYPGQAIQLAYGSLPNKNFGFVLIGAGLASAVHASATWSKTGIVVNRIYMQYDKCYFRAKGERNSNFIVEVQGAVDNKEIKED
jgi:hypothetical protein